MANNIEDKLSALEKRLDALEEHEKINDESSIITYLLDIFNFKKFLRDVLNGQDKDNQRTLKFTDNFINVVLLLIFLVFIFLQAGEIKLEFNAFTIPLLIIGVVALFEFLGSNSGIFKGWLNSDIRTKDYLKNLPNITPKGALYQLRNQNFSTKCLNYFIDSIKNKETYNFELVDTILTTQRLRSSSIDLLFTEKKLMCINESTIIKILYKCGKYLNISHMESVYNTFKDNDKIIKLLVATNENVKDLVDRNPNDTNLKEYYSVFKSKKLDQDLICKVLSIRFHIRSIGTIIVLLITGFVYYSLTSPLARSSFFLSNTQVQSQAMAPIMLITIIVFGLCFVIIINIAKILEPILENMQYNRFIAIAIK